MNGFAVQMGVYAGPLETLLDLIESRKLSISDISLAEVADAYLAHIEKLPELPLAETSQFILVASTLLLIKSRTLLPNVELSNDEELSIQELERRLKQYALIRKGAKSLRQTWGKTPLRFALRRPARPLVFAPSEASTDTIFSALRRLTAILPKPQALVEATVAPVLALEDVIIHLKDRLSRAFKARWSEITKSANKGDRIVYFLAMLELVRHGSASITQDRLFGDIVIEAGETGTPRYGA